MAKLTETEPKEMTLGDIVTLKSGGPELTVVYINRSAGLDCPMVRVVGVTSTQTINLTLPMPCFTAKGKL